MKDWIEKVLIRLWDWLVIDSARLALWALEGRLNFHHQPIPIN
jgi:hypothetical protein